VRAVLLSLSLALSCSLSRSLSLSPSLPPSLPLSLSLRSTYQPHGRMAQVFRGITKRLKEETQAVKKLGQSVAFTFLKPVVSLAYPSCVPGSNKLQRVSTKLIPKVATNLTKLIQKVATNLSPAVRLAHPRCTCVSRYVKFL
jgi:hypothetical protein